MSTTALVLLLFIAWTLLLLVVMEIVRTVLVLSGRVPANGFSPDNANLAPFMQRLARAHANCLEGLPLFGGLLIVALLLNQPGITDPLAPWFLVARIVQSCIHLASTSAVAVMARFGAFAVQIAIAVFWTYALLVAG